jgi:hypothetical protein
LPSRFRPDNEHMFTRRFVLLATVLVTLNLVLWFAAPGFALRKALIAQLFGPNMVRLEVFEKTPVAGSTDWRIDRGIITNVTPTQLTLREAGGKIQPITISSTTRVIRLGRLLPLSALSRRWRVVVTWPLPTGAAESVDVEKIPRVRGAGLSG